MAKYLRVSLGTVEQVKVVKDRSMDGTVLMISVHGPFVFDLHREFRAAYVEATGFKNCIIDLKECDYIDSCALGMMLLLKHELGDGVDVEVTNSIFIIPASGISQWKRGDALKPQCGLLFDKSFYIVG